MIMMLPCKQELSSTLRVRLLKLRQFRNILNAIAWGRNLFRSLFPLTHISRSIRISQGCCMLKFQDLFGLLEAQFRLFGKIQPIHATYRFQSLNRQRLDRLQEGYSPIRAHRHACSLILLESPHLLRCCQLIDLGLQVLLHLYIILNYLYLRKLLLMGYLATYQPLCKFGSMASLTPTRSP